MRNSRSFNFNVIYFFMIVVAVVVTIIASTNPYERDVHLIRDGAEDYNTGWEYKNSRIDSYYSCTLPLSLDRYDYQDMTVRKFLGEESKDGTYIMYRSKHAENHVYIGNREIYTYGDKQLKLFPLPGSAWIIIPLHDSYQGQYLSIELYRIEPKYGGIMETVIIGDRADMLERLLTENLFGLITCFIIAFSSVLLFMLGIIEKRMIGSINLFYLALSTVLIFIWSLNETHCTQLFFGNMETISILTYESLAILPLSILSYYRNSHRKKVRELCNRISFIPVLNFLILNVLHFIGIFDMSELLILTHLTIFITTVTICYGHIRSGGAGIKHGTESIPEFGVLGFLILAITIFIDIGHYYASNFIDASRYSRVGLLIFILLLAVDTMHITLSDELDVRKAEVYKSIAFTDTLTGLGNRQAYEQEIERIEEREELLNHLVIGILDLNNLKKTNDSMGHAEGDRYIITISDFIQNYFGKIAKIFRIGGDEFAIVFTGHDSDVFFETEAGMFDDIMKDSRKNINFAYGSAVYNHITDKNAGDTIRRADAKMYESKRKYKHNSGIR